MPNGTGDRSRLVMRTIARPPSAAAAAGLLLGSVLGLPVLAAETAPASRIEETYACLQVGLAVPEDQALDLGKPLSPQYSVGARLSGQSCDEVRSHALSASKVVPVIAALRQLGAQMKAGTPDTADLAECVVTGGSITFAGKEPQVTTTGLQFWLEACGKERHVLATLDSSKPAPTVSQLQLVPAQAPDPVAEAMVADTLGRPWWKPDKLKIDAALSRESENGETAEDETKLRVEATWKRGADLTELTIDNEYETAEGEIISREVASRLRWIRDYEPGWFVMAEGYAERDLVELNDVDYEYLLLQAAAGGGYRWRWADRGMLRVAVLWNEFDVSLLDLDTDLQVGAPSIYLATEWQLTPRLSAKGWGEFYYWERGEVGSDIDAEMHYELTQHLGFGLRWTYTRDAASLNRTNEEETRLYLRYRF